MPDTEPTDQEVFQEEESDLRAVPVTIEGPVRIQPLGSVTWSVIRFALTTDPQLILSRDVKRKRVVFIVSADTHFADSQAWAAAAVGVAKAWPANVLLELTHIEEIWACANTGNVNVTGFVEQWAN